MFGLGRLVQVAEFATESTRLQWKHGDRSLAPHREQERMAGEGDRRGLAIAVEVQLDQRLRAEPVPQPSTAP